jgi:hypothetical protein
MVRLASQRNGSGAVEAALLELLSEQPVGNPLWSDLFRWMAGRAETLGDIRSIGRDQPHLF